ncbi:MAG: 2,3-diphosphoglycerate synthetase [Methanopyri archaeon]|nr:2,3-diphosphoglycerate synthetase [Methanopyri archaeon]
MRRILALVDGEHYIPVTKEALEKVEEELGELVGAVFIGGTEKIGTPEDVKEKLGVKVWLPEEEGDGPPIDLIEKVVKEHDVDVVLDLSDEPVVSPDDRFLIGSAVLEAGAEYWGPDFRFEPVEFHDVLEKPSMRIIGTGKRVGKTAVSAYACRVLHARGYNPCVVVMGRGGPEEPEVVRGDEIELTPEYLLEQAERGKHAASDHWEDALLSRIPTVGCRRCAGGLAGKTFVTNMVRGAEIANELPTDFVVVEGSGAAVPPIETDAGIITVGAAQPLRHIGGYYGPYRIRMCDLAVVTMCEEPLADEKKVKEVERTVRSVKEGIEVVLTVFRPKPTADVEGKKVVFVTTAPEEVVPKLVEHLEEEYGCEVVGTSPHLSNRPKLMEDLEKYIGEAEVLLTELKAAAVDVATRVALEKGLDVVYVDNVPVAVGGDYDHVGDAVEEVAKLAIERFEG